MSTKIEWTQESWSPIVGCSKVSPGCENCYAERMAKRLKAMGQEQYQDVVDKNGWTGILTKSPDAMQKPFAWKKPRMIFVCSMSDLFHRTVPGSLIDDVMRTICENPQHTFQILTKRPNRMSVYFKNNPVPDNVWVGVTAEDQQRADERIPYLLQVNAKVRFVSVEPMLGPVNLTYYLNGGPERDDYGGWYQTFRPLDWVICGGESGPGTRPMNPDWARGLRDQCVSAKVPFFFKQWGEWLPDKIYLNGPRKYQVKHIGSHIYSKIGKKMAGRELDGEVWDQMPERENQT